MASPGSAAPNIAPPVLLGEPGLDRGGDGVVLVVLVVGVGVGVGVGVEVVAAAIEAAVVASGATVVSFFFQNFHPASTSETTRQRESRSTSSVDR